MGEKMTNKRTYYTVDSEQDDYWLRKALEAGSIRLKGDRNWWSLYFTTREAAEEFVRDVFADYCEDLSDVSRRGFARADDEAKAAKEVGLSSLLMRERDVYRNRFVPDGTSIEVTDWGQMMMTRKVEAQVFNTVTERHEIIVGGETYFKEVKREVASNWYEAYPEVVRVQVNTVEMYVVGEDEP